MLPRKIVVITDCTDIAYSELYHRIDDVLSEHNVDDVHIAPLVPVKNFSIEHAAFSIRLMAELCRPGTMFHVVVNGTNKSPERIFGKTKNGIYFVGNNSGYFNWMIEDFGLDCLYQNFQNRSKNSKSFGGKHVGAPTAAKIMSGVAFEELGNKVDEAFLSDYKITDGAVVHCDNFGLIKIKHPGLDNLSENQRLKIFVNQEPRIEARFSTKWKIQPDGDWILFTGSSLNGLPELGKIRAQNSASELGVKEGDVINWEPI